ncbi:MerR-like helix-turn-helix DNA binding domain protein [Arthrobacter phage Sonali]|uniref:MerR-like helix-turn-helix DNA binding domain protein n=1 Tax=Arthrobacter phage Sonali TaxID=2510495 RepID=A0A411CQE8_9CAUD|nr:DNA binding protein [Arthrobacter phage Sonali]QAY16144.1 MerR-like helix-turn-helix DNA binding domain protein [Arthrobacter phage Sonali]
MADTVYTIKDLAERTGLTPNLLRQWKNRGKLPEPTYTLGQSPAWSGEPIESWLASNPRQGTLNNRREGRTA